jgi:hypothetical protein
MVDEEDEGTLAAIDEGVRDAKAGRVVPAGEARQLMPKRITASSIFEERITAVPSRARSLAPLVKTWGFGMTPLRVRRRTLANCAAA